MGQVDNLRYEQVPIPSPSIVTRPKEPIPVWVRTHLIKPVENTRVQPAVAIGWTRTAVHIETETGRRLWLDPKDVRRRIAL